MAVRVLTWKINLKTSISYILTDTEYVKLNNALRKQGNYRPRYETDKHITIFLDHIVSMEPDEEMELVNLPTEDSVENETEEKPVEDNPVNKQQETLDRMIELSNCKHENSTIYKRETKTGVKYFPVCDVCARPGRFVKADTLTDEQKNDAQLLEFKE